MEIADMDGLRSAVVKHARSCVDRAGRCTNEESTKQFLILPFLALLGYDVHDPDEVTPEHAADFSEKYQNRVDYAVLQTAAPVIAIECKKVGALLRDDRGQLKSYFNACPTVKLGILCDGLLYDFYTDSDSENMMDDEPFLRLDLRAFAEETIDDVVLQGLAAFRKGSFRPEDVGAEAKRKFTMSSFIAALEGWASEPDDDLVRLLIDRSEISGTRTKRVLEEYRPLAREALAAFVDQRIMARLALPGSRLDAKISPSAAVSTPEPFAAATVADNGGIVTTVTELSVYDYARRRLAFLVKEESLFREIERIVWRDYKTTFRIFYVQERNGALFNFREGSDVRYIFNFPALDDREIRTNSMSDIDDSLLQIFRQRVREAGIEVV